MYLMKYSPINSLFDEFLTWPSTTKPTTEYYAEIKDNTYSAQVALPKNLDLDKITCEIKDNALIVSCPVKVESRQIKVSQ